MEIATLRRLSLSLFLAFCFVGSGRAASDRWLPYPDGVGGPWGGSVRRVVSLDAEGETLVAATGGGIYRSTDAGRTWSAANAGLQSLDITDVAVCAGTPSRLLASTYLAGLYTSSDGGLSWIRRGEGGLPRDPLWRVAVDPVDPDRCFAATLADFRPQLLASSDGGGTWQRVDYYGITRLLFASDRTLYFSNRNGRIFTLPLGQSVPGALSRLAGFSWNASIADFALPGGDGRVIAVAHEGNGLVVSEDWGSTWQERYFSTIPGGNSQFTYVDAVAGDPGNPGRILFHVNDPNGSASRTTALYESVDLGVSRAALPLPEKGMEMSGDPGGGLFVTPASEWILENKAGLFRRDGRAGAFVHSSRGLAAFDARDLAWGPAEELAVAGGRGFVEPGNAGLYVWDTAGGDWVRRARDLSSNPGLDAGSTNIVRYQGTDLWACQDGLGVFRSADAGATWEDLSGGIGFGADDAFYGLAFAPDGSAEVLLGTQQGVHRTRGAPSWEVLRPAHGPAEAHAWRVAPDVRSPKGFYVAAANGGGQFWVTSDTGDSWTDLTPAFLAGASASTLAASERVAGHALVATRFAGLWETLDGGANWSERTGEGLPWGEATALALGGADDAWMAAHVRGAGVFLSVDAGATWASVPEGLSAPDGPFGSPLTVQALQFEPDQARLVAAVKGGSLRYLDVPLDTRPPLAWAEPAGGSILGATTVALKTDERLGSLYYTLDGSEPTASSAPYEAPLEIAATTTVRFAAVDPAGNRTEVAETYRLNRAPALDPIGDQSIGEGEALTFAVTATDPDGDELSYSAVGLPEGAAFDPATGTFTWTPGFGVAGSYAVSFRVTDAGVPTLDDEEAVTITVADVNWAPAFEAVGGRSAREGEALTFAVTGSDPDGDELSYSAVGLPGGAAFDPATRTFSWTPGFGDAGSYEVTFRVLDRGVPPLAAEETVAIVVADVNRPPVLGFVGGQDVREGEALTVTLTATDPDGDELSYSAEGLPGGAAFDPATRTFAWTPGFGAAGSHGVTFRVTDGGVPPLDDEEAVTIAVADVNRAPAFEAVGGQRAREGEALTFAVTGSDPDGDELSYSADGLPGGAAFDPATRTFSWTPGFGEAGSYEVTFRAVDGGVPPLAAEEAVTIVVADVNRPPVLDPVGGRSGREGETITLTVTGTDPDGDELSYSADGLPGGAAFDPAAGTFTWTPGFSDAGTYAVTFRVADGGVPRLGDEETVAITVADVNRPPVLEIVGSRTAREGTTVVLVAAATDPDGDPLTLEARGLPDGAVFDPATGQFVWTPPEGGEGLHELTLAAVDSGSPALAAEETVPILVTPGDDGDSRGAGCFAAAALGGPPGGLLALMGALLLAAAFRRGRL